MAQEQSAQRLRKKHRPRAARMSPATGERRERHPQNPRPRYNFKNSQAGRAGFWGSFSALGREGPETEPGARLPVGCGGGGGAQENWDGKGSELGLNPFRAGNGLRGSNPHIL